MKHRLLIVFLLAGCSSPPSASPEMIQPTSSVQPATASRPTPSAEITPAVSPSPTEAPASDVPTADPTADLFQPVAEAAGARFDSWSPDSQWAAY